MTLDLFVASYAIAYITFTFGIASTFARFYSRRLIVKLWGLDDSASCAVLLVNIVHQVCLQLFFNLGCGKLDNPNCSFQSLDLLQAAFIEEVVIYTAHFVIKITFLLFYLRLSPGQSFRISVFFGFALNSAVLLISLFITIFQCVPFKKILNPLLYPETSCMDMRVVMLTPPALNIFMDLYILIIPLPTIWSLQMSLRRKVTILSVFTCGLISMAVAILRLPVLVSVTSVSTDVSLDVGKMVIVAAFEVQCAILAVNLPSLKPLWTHIKARISSTDSKDSSSGEQHRLTTSWSEQRGGRSFGSITRLEGTIRHDSEQHLVHSGLVSACSGNDASGGRQLVGEHGITAGKEENVP